MPNGKCIVVVRRLIQEAGLAGIVQSAKQFQSPKMEGSGLAAGRSWPLLASPDRVLLRGIIIIPPRVSDGYFLWDLDPG